MIRTITTLVLVLAPLTAVADKDFEAGSGATYDCGEDPVVNVTHGDGTYTFTGACTEINLNGSKLVITIADVQTLNINGASNAIKVAELGAVNINGTKNKISWKKAKAGKKPKAAVNGKGNAVTKVK